MESSLPREKSLQPHALVFPFPFVGHIHPLLFISQLLASCYGFSITFLSTPYRLAQLKDSHSHAAQPCSITFKAIPGLPDLSALDHDGIAGISKLFHALRCSRDSGAFEQWLLELHEKKGHPLSCIISDTFVSWTQPLADKLGVPRAAFWASTAISYSLYMHASDLPPSIQAHPPYEGNEVREDDSSMFFKALGICNKLPTSTLPMEHTLKALGICNKLPTSALPTEHTLKASLPYIEMDTNCTWLMFNSSKHIDNEPLQSIKVSMPNTKLLAIVCNPFPFPKEMVILNSCARVSGDYLNSNTSNSRTLLESKENASCLDWLDSKPTHSVIYIAFGSIVSLERDKLQELALGIEKSKRNFLWVLRPIKDNIQDNKCIEDSDPLPKGFLERTKTQGLIVGWAPQLQVLAHPSVGCFLTHCGWNSIMESLSCGVPLLGLPPLDFSDMKIVAWYIEHVWKVGLQLRMDKLSRNEVDKALRALLQDNHSLYSENASHISKELRLTTPQEELRLFVEDVITRKNSIV